MTEARRQWAKNICTIGVVCLVVGSYAFVLGFFVPWVSILQGNPLVPLTAPIYSIGIVSGATLTAGLLMYLLTRKA